MSESKIAQALTKLFTRHRIVFWYDAKKELRRDYETLELPGVEKIELNNNEFSIKHRILREQPDQKFLLYHEGAQPADVNNWLLDVQLGHDEFRTEQAAIWLSDLELGLEFSDVVESHVEFFTSAKRLDGLKRLLKPDDTPGMIRLKMLAVCASSEPRLEDCLENLLAEEAVNSDQYSRLCPEKDNPKFRLIERCRLDGFLWEQMKRIYGYESESPGIEDFAIQLFKFCYFQNFTEYSPHCNYHLSSDALVFLKRWKDSRRYGEFFEALSSEYADMLNIEQDLGRREYRTLAELDYFSLIDQKILSDLVKSVADRTISAGDCAVLVRQRRMSHWYNEFRNHYEAVDVAARLIAGLAEVNLVIESLPDGVQSYCQSWFKIDQLYRKYVYHAGKSGQTSLLESLTVQIENLYSNSFLLKVNNNWQQHVDAADKWDMPPIPLQRSFFDKWVRPFLKDNKKIVVIISDALRYEIGEELLSLIRQEDRYTAGIESAITMLPSYTQLGMAALLPNRGLAFADDETGTVLVNGKSSQGTVNRNKILCEGMEQRGKVIKADDLFHLNGDDSRSLLRDHDVIYVYHNRIDAVGDKRESEDRVFEAVEEGLEELIKLIKKLTGANANNLLVTADHGFIYQDLAIDESDYLSAEPAGDKIVFRDRRFVLGKGLAENAGLRKFSAAQIGLQGDMEIQIPKSINRLRLRGSGSRYVHGGATLQETVIPVIQINKKRQSDISIVEVDILRGATSVITSGQLAVVFYQTRPVSDKVRQRALRIGIYTQSGELVSDRHDLVFDMESENPRERELPVRFVLTQKADAVNGQEVILRMEEQVAGTSHYREYRTVRYLMRRSFKSDFDF